MDKPTQVSSVKYQSKNTTPNVSDWNKPSTNQVVSPTDDPKGFFQTAVDRHGFFSLTEPGIVHPTKTSLVKLRDNGMIDVFVTTNQGIRIDPNTKTITVITNRLDIRAGEHREWIESNSIIRVKKNWELKSDSNIVMKALKEIQLECGKDYTRTVHGNLKQTIDGEWKIIVAGNTSIETKGNAKIKAEGSIEVESVGTMSIKSGGQMTLDAGSNTIVFKGGLYDFE